MPANPNRITEGIALLKQYHVVIKLYAPYVLWGVCGVLFVLLLLRGRGGRRGRGSTSDARWASRRDLAKAYLLGYVGIVLGHIGGLIVKYWGRGHVFVVAASQSGKSNSIVVPTLLEQQPKGKNKVTVIIHDPKDELYPCTAPYRRTISRVIRLAPMDPQTDHYNPLDALALGSDMETANLQLLGKLLVNPEGLPVTSEGSRHYMDMTETAVRGLTVYGLKSKEAVNLGEFYMLTTQGDLSSTFAAMKTMDHPAVRQACTLLASMDDNQYDGVMTTLQRVYQLYGDPLIGEMVSYSDFTLDELRRGPEPLSIYVSIPFEHMERLRPFTCLAFQQWLGHATAAPRNWRQLGWHRVLGMGEEFPSLKHLNIAKDIFNQGAGLGVQLCLITPSLNDIEEIWGTHHNFLDNAHVQVFFSITDGRVADRVSTRLGTRTVRKRRVTWSGGRRSVTEEDVKEPLMDVSTLMHLDPGDVVLLARNHQVVVQQTPWETYEPWASRGVRA